MIYVVTFCMSALFASGAAKFKTKKNKWIIYICSAMSIFFPALLGGLRDVSIGTDINVYLLNNFNYAHVASFRKFFTTYSTLTGTEPIYRLIVYGVALFTNDINVLLFVFQFLTILFVYIGAFKHRDKISLPLVMLLYFFIFYNDTYNLIRQYLAIAIVFANIDKLEERKYKKFLVWVIVAALVHATAIICIGLIIMHYFVTSGRLENKVIRKFILVLGVMLVCLFFSQIIEILVQTGLLSSKYLYYIKHESVSDNNLASILYLSELILCIIYSKRLKTIMGNADFYVMNAYVLFVLLQLSRVIFYGNRISLFFAMPNLLLLSFLPKLENTGVKRLAVSSTICILGFGYWWYLYVYGGVSQTYPYMLGV